MKTTHHIEGTLENVEILAIDPCFNWTSLISRVTIRAEDKGVMTFPYLGFINQRMAAEMMGNHAIFIEEEEGLIFKDVYQVLIGPGFEVAPRRIPKSQANKIMREFSDYFIPPKGYCFPVR